MSLRSNHTVYFRHWALAGALATPLAFAGIENPAPSDREEVIAAVECSVEDPGDLNDYLGIPRSARLRIETLSTYVSTLIVDDEVYFTAFPAVLNFRGPGKKFSFGGTEVSEEQTTSVSLDIQGSFANRGQGEFLFYFKDPKREALGAATLKSCQRTL